ncbi:MAG: hypothetical protein LCH84_19300 [Gemmatimonadetes bacterium]|nr:hypothetical protein [Gemmatimonadota bacterium]
MPTFSSLPLAPTATPAPPLTLPVAFLAASLGWLAVAAALLPVVAPALARGDVFAPAVFALVHVLTLGVVGTAITGTLHQFVPVGLGVPLRSVRLGYLALALHSAGTLLLVLGFWWWHGAAQGIGWTLLFAGMGASSRNVLRAYRVSVQGKLVGWYLLVAHSALGAGMFVAAARLGETFGWWHVDRMALLAAHALLGAVGFGTLSAIGVGSRMLPTFLQAPGDDARLLRALLWLCTLALTAFTAGAVLGAGVVMRVSALALLASGILSLSLARRWWRRRGRGLDAVLWHLVSAFAALAVAVCVGLLLIVGDAYAFRRWAALLVALVVGWLVTLLAGVLARILPRMTVAAQAARARSAGGPAVAVPPAPPNALLRTDLLWGSCGALSCGWVALVIALLAGNPAWARGAALCWSGGVVCVLATHVGLWWRVRVARGRAPRGPVSARRIMLS